jgi:NitT/TauT family transport system substrate-binding protein
MLIPAAAVMPRRACAQSMPIRLGAGLDDGLTPVLYAQQSGIFKRFGLDVSVVSSSNGAALAVALAGGSIDIAKTALMSLIAAYAHGVRLKIVAGGTIYDPKSPTDQLCVLPDSPIRSPADLTGKIVAVGTLQSLDQMATQMLIDKAGGKAATVRFIELRYSAMVSALQAGRADCASMANPILQNALESRSARSIGAPYDALGAGVLIAAWICSDQFAQQDPAAAQRFGAALRAAAEYTNTHHDETAGLLADYAKVDPDVIRKMKRDTIATHPAAASAIHPCIDAAYKYGYITVPFAAEELLLPLK